MAPYNLPLPRPVPEGNGSYRKHGDHQEKGNNKQQVKLVKRTTKTIEKNPHEEVTSLTFLLI